MTGAPDEGTPAPTTPDYQKVIDELKAQYGDDLVTELPCFPDGGTGPNFLIHPSKAALEEDFEVKLV